MSRSSKLTMLKPWLENNKGNLEWKKMINLREIYSANYRLLRANLKVFLLGVLDVVI